MRLGLEYSRRTLSFDSSLLNREHSFSCTQFGEHYLIRETEFVDEVVGRAF